MAEQDNMSILIEETTKSRFLLEKLVADREKGFFKKLTDTFKIISGKKEKKSHDKTFEKTEPEEKKKSGLETTAQKISDTYDKTSKLVKDNATLLTTIAGGAMLLNPKLAMSIFSNGLNFFKNVLGLVEKIADADILGTIGSLVKLIKENPFTSLVAGLLALTAAAKTFLTLKNTSDALKDIWGKRGGEAAKGGKKPVGVELPGCVKLCDGPTMPDVPDAPDRNKKGKKGSKGNRGKNGKTTRSGSVTPVEVPTDIPDGKTGKTTGPDVPDAPDKKSKLGLKGKIGAAGILSAITSIVYLGSEISEINDELEKNNITKEEADKQKNEAYGGAAGGMTGGALGSIAGGLAGSLLGPAGTVVGSMLGGYIGDAIGSALGRTAGRAMSGGGASSGPVSIPSPTGPGAGKTDSAQKAMDYFVSKGWTKEQAAGIVGNLQTESGKDLNTKAEGDLHLKARGGSSQGIAQWREGRLAKFKEVVGKDVKDASLEEQLSFVDWELKNTEKRAGDRLKEATTADEAAALTDQFYERSDGKHRGGRVANALALLKDDKTKAVTPDTQTAALQQQNTNLKAQSAAVTQQTMMAAANNSSNSSVVNTTNVTNMNRPDALVQDMLMSPMFMGA